MIDNVTPIDILRRIKGLSRSIVTLNKLIAVKQNYLNNLSLFTEYSSINSECHSIKAEIMTISGTIERQEHALKRLRKEI